MIALAHALADREIDPLHLLVLLEELVVILRAAVLVEVLIRRLVVWHQDLLLLLEGIWLIHGLGLKLTAKLVELWWYEVIIGVSLSLRIPLELVQVVRRSKWLSLSLRATK